MVEWCANKPPLRCANTASGRCVIWKTQPATVVTVWLHSDIPADMRLSYHRMSNFFVCLVVPCLAGTVIGAVFLTSSIGVNGDLAGRLETMDAARDFESITGGCTIQASSFEQKSYSYSSSSCRSQCTSAKACADRYIHTIKVNSDGTTHILDDAPEDTLLSTTTTCEAGTTAAVSAYSVGASVACWRAKGTITRNEVTPGDPRTASYAGLEACGYGCQTQIGFACGGSVNGSACIAIIDPAEQVQYYASMPSLGTRLTRDIAICVGSIVGLMLSCALNYVMHRCDQCEDESSSSEDGKANA